MRWWNEGDFLFSTPDTYYVRLYLHNNISIREVGRGEQKNFTKLRSSLLFILAVAIRAWLNCTALVPTFYCGDPRPDIIKYSRIFSLYNNSSPRWVHTMYGNFEELLALRVLCTYLFEGNMISIAGFSQVNSSKNDFICRNERRKREKYIRTYARYLLDIKGSPASIRAILPKVVIYSTTLSSISA